jgi:hypothetical protein
MSIAERCTQAEKIEKLREMREAYGFGEMPEDQERVVCRKRRVVSILLILSIVAFVETAAFLLNSENPQAAKLSVVRLVYSALALPVMIYALSAASDRMLRRRFGPMRTLVSSVALAAVVGALAMTLTVVVGRHIPLARDVLLTHKWSVAKAMLLGALIGQVQLGLWALAFVYPFAAHDARVRALEAEKLRTAAELARLRGHLEPHFLLNTLNAIAGLTTEEPKEARRLLACLGDLLRDALRDGDEMQSLGEQEGWLRRYADILESRHRGALKFVWQLDPAIKSVQVPRLLLQPLVENAIKHGALRRREGGTVTLRAYRGSPTPEIPDGPVVCVVEDDGPGFADRPIRQGALGLRVVRRRLELKYAHWDFRLETGSDGTRAIVELAVPRASATLNSRILTVDGTDAIAAGPAPVLRKTSSELA